MSNMGIRINSMGTSMRRTEVEGVRRVDVAGVDEHELMQVPPPVAGQHAQVGPEVTEVPLRAAGHKHTGTS